MVVINGDVEHRVPLAHLDVDTALIVTRDRVVRDGHRVGAAYSADALIVDTDSVSAGAGNMRDRVVVNLADRRSARRRVGDLNGHASSPERRVIVNVVGDAA